MKSLEIEVGDGVINTSLFPSNFPCSGGFPYSREDVATVVSIEGDNVAIQWQPKYGNITYHKSQLLLVRKV